MSQSDTGDRQREAEEREMAYIDERIAQLEREARRLKKEEQMAEQAVPEKEEEPHMTLEEMLEAVREGSVVLPSGEKHSFEVRDSLEEHIPLVLIKDIYTGVEEKEGVSIFADHDRNISQMLTMADKPMGGDSIGAWKKQLETGMKQSGLYAEVTQEKILENLDYLVFRTPTAKGWTYNFQFRLQTGSRRVVGNYNCYEKDKDTYGLMLEALLHRMNELLSEAGR